MKDRVLAKRSDVRLREISGKNIIVTPGKSHLDLFEINEVGLAVWRMIDSKRSVDDIVREMQLDYPDEATVASDVLRFIEQLVANRLVEPVGGPEEDLSVNVGATPCKPYGGFIEDIVGIHGVEKRGRVPLFGGIDFTYHCNLKCEHCYRPCVDRELKTELSCEQWQEILKKLSEAGTLEIGITGGEPLMRSDFIEFYSQACSYGMVLTIFTNGTLITEEVASIWKNKPPKSIEISVYGADEDMYARTTGSREAFSRLVEGLSFLREKNVAFSLKAMLWSTNIGQIEQIRRFVRQYQGEFVVDAILQPQMDGFEGPIKKRLPPKRVVEMEMSAAANREAWRLYMIRSRKAEQRYKYDCNAGINSYQIDPYGDLGLCIMSREPGVNLLGRDFLDIWEKDVADRRFQECSKDSECYNCADRMFCDYCPGWAKLEGFEEKPVPYLCSIARERKSLFEEVEFGNQKKGGKEL